MLRPLHDNVIVRRVDAEEVTKGGIILPEIVQGQEPTQKGVVVATGPGKLKDGVRHELDVRIGEEVLFKRYAERQTYDHEDFEHVVLLESDILCAVGG